MAKYRVPVLEKFHWQQPVLDNDLTAPPSAPTKGDRYLVATGASGDWAGQAGKIAWFDGTIWKFDAPAEGWFVWLLDENKLFYYSGTVWVEFAQGGDMMKSVYDADDDGRVDVAEGINDGTYSATAQNIADAVTKRHTQNTDQYLDFGGASQISASQAKEAYDKRAQYDSDLGVILFDNL